jgi:hypothetical protein
MNLRLGIYEFFSRIVPGGLYIVAVAHFLSVLGIVNLDLQAINDISLVASIGLIVVAYILGGAFDIFSLALFRLFNKKGFSGRTLAQFKKKYEDCWQIDLKDHDHIVLLAFIRTKNLELAGELDRHNALSIMLRNVSLGLLFMAANGLIQIFMSGNSINIFIFLSMLVLSMLIIRESIKFRGYFLNGIFETTLAYRIDLETAIKPVVHSGVRRTKLKRIDKHTLPEK